jgi:hypothetical protein
VPITCVKCLRTSALGLPALMVEQKIDDGSEITLQCGFDGETWDASPRERSRLARLCEENRAIPSRKHFRFNTDTVDKRARA